MQAVVVAGICEFLGAVLLGASVADTIKSGIAKLATFNGAPGMQCRCLLEGHLVFCPINKQVTHSCRLADGWDDGCPTDDRVVAGSSYLSRASSVHFTFCRSVFCALHLRHLC